MDNRPLKIFAFSVLCAAIAVVPMKIFAQDNGNFETGLQGWRTTGSVMVDSVNAQQGKYCAMLGKKSSVILTLPTEQLSIIQSHVFVKCINGARAYYRTSFLDATGKELMHYQTGAITDSVYKEVGDYTESPALATTLEIAILSDSSHNGSVFVDHCTIDTAIGVPAHYHPPMFDPDAYMRPFWNSDTIMNETVLLFSSGQQVASGRLLYQPKNILSVRSFDLQKAFIGGKDYTLNANTISRVTGSAIPWRADTSFDQKTDLAWYDLQSQWVVVTYCHVDKWSGPRPKFKGGMVPALMKKLASHTQINAVAYGMSITRGMDVSGYDNVAPYMPPYTALFARALQRHYHSPVRLFNAALPGSTVSWGADHADDYVSPLKPDLVILDFGMNDFWRTTPAEFKMDIETMMRKIRRSNPSVSFMLLSNMKFDPAYVLDSDKNKAFYINNFNGYALALKSLENEGVIDVDMTTLSDWIYKNKKAKDCIVNPLHPNDYMARWYAQAMVAALIKEVPVMQKAVK